MSPTNYEEFQRLDKEQALQAQRLTHMDGKLDGIKTDVSEIKTALLGDTKTTDGKPGIVIRVDRLEQTEGFIRWGFGLLATGVTGLILEKAVGLLK